MPRNCEKARPNLVDQIVCVDRHQGSGYSDFVVDWQQARTKLELQEPRMEVNGTSPYINQPTENLVTDLEELIRQRGDLSESSRVIEAFIEFKYICQQPPAIVEYIHKKTDTLNPEAGFTRDQIKLHMFSTVARSSSTWGTIQAEAALLNLAGDHEIAAIINANAMNETGDKHHRPHSLLLFDCFDVVGEALHLEALSPASYHLARQIHRLRQARNDSQLSDIKEIQNYLQHNEV